MREVKKSQMRPYKIILNEPQLQHDGPDLGASECCHCSTKRSFVFVLFDASAELLSCKQCLLIHICVPAYLLKASLLG